MKNYLSGPKVGGEVRKRPQRPQKEGEQGRVKHKFPREWKWVTPNKKKRGRQKEGRGHRVSNFLDHGTAGWREKGGLSGGYGGTSCHVEESIQVKSSPNAREAGGIRRDLSGGWRGQDSEASAE